MYLVLPHRLRLLLHSQNYTPNNESGRKILPLVPRG